jgi:lipase
VREPKFSYPGDGFIGVWDWEATGGPQEGCVLLCHATGFHARCWDQIIRRLPHRWRCVALDMRGHGRSGNPNPPGQPPLWKDFGADVARIIDLLGLVDLIGVGHSMGGHSVVHAASLRPGAFTSLVLLDPVIRPHGSYGAPWVVSHFARKRRNEWKSADEMYERFKDRPPFSAWEPEIVRDYCDHALNGNVLACTPDFEGSIYENSSVAASDISDELGRIAIPVTVMRSHLVLQPGADMNGSPCDPVLASRFPNARDVEVPRSHFFPMEDPGLVADTIVESGAVRSG